MFTSIVLAMAAPVNLPTYSVDESGNIHGIDRKAGEAMAAIEGPSKVEDTSGGETDFPIFGGGGFHIFGSDAKPSSLDEERSQLRAASPLSASMADLLPRV